MHGHNKFKVVENILLSTRNGQHSFVVKGLGCPTTSDAYWVTLKLFTILSSYLVDILSPQVATYWKLDKFKGQRRNLVMSITSNTFIDIKIT